MKATATGIDRKEVDKIMAKLKRKKQSFLQKDAIGKLRNKTKGKYLYLPFLLTRLFEFII